MISRKKLGTHENHAISLIPRLQNPPNMTRFNSHFRAGAQNTPLFHQKAHFFIKFHHFHRKSPEMQLFRENATFCALARSGGTLRQPLKTLRKTIPFGVRNRPGGPFGPKTSPFGDFHPFLVKMAKNTPK